LLGARVTVTVYVPVALPSRDVTTIVISLFPTFIRIVCDAGPLATGSPFTHTVAPWAETVGVNVILSMLFATSAE